MESTSARPKPTPRARYRIAPRQFLVLVAALCSGIPPGPDGTVNAASDPSTIFKTKCISCHTFGRGDRVGPDLKGVTMRHSRPWLVKWIRSSETQIRGGDREAVALFRRYGQQRMPDHDLADADILALLDYLDAGGPSTDVQLRRAADATQPDVELGRKLFFGEAGLRSGDGACVFCHRVSGTMLGGSLGPDLTGVFVRFEDRALDDRLKRRCVTRPVSPDGSRVADAESLALRAFLRSVGSAASTDRAHQSTARTKAPSSP